MDKFESVGIIKKELEYNLQKLEYFKNEINKMKIKCAWTRKDLIDLFNEMIPNFNHKETGKFLDGRM